MSTRDGFTAAEPLPTRPDRGAERRAMVESQLRARDIHDPRVLRAMSEVPREAFVPASEAAHAYADRPLPLGFGQTISQPYTVAFMSQALQLRGTERVLEIGTGSGYGAAVLGRLAAEVHTVECVPQLARSARSCLERLGCRNVLVHEGDGTWGWPEFAPYEAIVVTAGGRELPEPYRPQLAEGGRIVIPLGADRRGQSMCRFTLRRGLLDREDLGGFAFVPLVGTWGWPDETPG